MQIVGGWFCPTELDRAVTGCTVGTRQESQPHTQAMPRQANARVPDPSTEKLIHRIRHLPGIGADPGTHGPPQALSEITPKQAQSQEQPPRALLGVAKITPKPPACDSTPERLRMQSSGFKPNF